MNQPELPISQVRGVIVQILPGGYPTLDRVAKRLNVSPRTLQRRLGAYGMTHTQLVNQLRIVKACQLLAQHDTRISHIARETGFATPSAFSRAFHSWTGVSPRAFRNGF